ncbi:tannase and feruloyl esterase [Aspergillus ellipticus CBS 707.79]|uniref:Carboxylic ester hydrolase n=1 Tax=Aspergillus ellipticus CBS 707.79 TaxID=1448320 RepID=A0A319CVE9_9EURO|nr:tannase and feruloyl esterase [Aspergillus ellipticus CBS 707.79]
MAAAAAILAAPVAAGSCSSSNLSTPSIPNGQVLSLSADPVPSYPYANTTLSFCNVTVTYTHPGKNDTIHTTVWLPSSKWNARLQGSGGSGYAMRSSDTVLAQAIASNYSVVATDGGHAIVSSNSASWSLTPDNKVNMALLEDFASIALSDAATIGKQITTAFYHQPPHHSYWNGCSTGGRQGLMLAQRDPTAYDGIMAAAPAINWPTFLVAEFWPQFVMNQLSTHPPQCITAAITAATIHACDALDGVVDGVISNPDNCPFDPTSLINTTIPCPTATTTTTNTTLTITPADAHLVNLIWSGMRSSNSSFQWYGLEKGAPLSLGLANTTCPSPSPVNCTGTPFPISADWIQRFILQSPTSDLTTLTHPGLDNILSASIQKYNPIIATADPDLSAFKSAGGKLLTWHGLADQLIFPKGTEHYYRSVRDQDPDVRDFYRFFYAPGVEHCEGGVGPVPTDPLAQVVDWVERGVVPERLWARAQDGRTRGLCAWPEGQVFLGGDVWDAGAYGCRNGTGAE